MENKENLKWTNDQELAYQITILVAKITLGEGNLRTTFTNHDFNGTEEITSGIAKYLAISPYFDHILDIANEFQLEEKVIREKVAHFLANEPTIS
ncbi:hypothetical protein [Mucilaginibacter sp.]|uniref:hypothetical protein n=1 Tax=Mucilaginibacter sp. TaxID=1882438 RepID=UPI0035BC1D76